MQPGPIPIELPTRTRATNLNSASPARLTIPQAVLLRANGVLG